jgi:hypothetical protein
MTTLMAQMEGKAHQLMETLMVNKTTGDRVEAP